MPNSKNKKRVMTKMANDEDEDPMYGDFDIDNNDDFEEQDGADEDLKPAKKNKSVCSPK
jgi:hypothetical protein